MDEFNLNQFYELAAIYHFNPERRNLLQPLIKKLFSEKIDKLDIHKNIVSNPIYEITNSSSKCDILEDLFKRYDFVITSNINTKNVIDYINLKYYEYIDVFLKYYNMSLEAFTYISFVIWKDYLDRVIQISEFEEYQFETKEDYANPNYFGVPDKKYIENWKNISTFRFDEIVEKIYPFSKDDFTKYLELYSFNITKIKVELDLRFREYPLFYYGEKVILVDPEAFFFYLPHKIDILLSKTKSYNSTKGRVFENIILDLIDEIPIKKELKRNLEYEGFELDGLLNLKHSTWFVECKSRNISTESLKGNRNKIQKDIEKSIRAGIKQGERAISHKDSEFICHLGIKNFTGIIVVVEGIFPNLRIKTLLPNNPIDQCKYPVCVFNYFDLRTIVNQHDANLFEDFLIWRSQKDMPIYAFDECDYWDFYTKMKHDKERKGIFKLAQKNKNIVLYVGDRFNDKRYISKIKTLR
ncbi:hypothetical protein [Methanosarcina sp. UBA411]|jgi:hypothetical protein|uniref:hypothetical protein n=1 Tax=Methanosarcina sp. UBA411 TaxID=1915589 RepID=UPI0025D7C31D|nr:hypothetical protein [Methanosarcina sp. UBA411]